MINFRHGRVQKVNVKAHLFESGLDKSSKNSKKKNDLKMIRNKPNPTQMMQATKWSNHWTNQCNQPKQATILFKASNQTMNLYKLKASKQPNNANKQVNNQCFAKWSKQASKQWIYIKQTSNQTINPNNASKQPSKQPNKKPKQCKQATKKEPKQCKQATKASNQTRNPNNASKQPNKKPKQCKQATKQATKQ